VVALLFLGLLAQDPVRDLVEKLGSDSLEEREAALEKLRTIGKPALPELEKAAKGRDPEAADRAKYLLRLIPIQEQMPARLLQLMPGLVQRFVLDDPHSWTQLLIDAMHEEMAHRVEKGEDLFKPGDLDGIVLPAFRGIRDKQDKDWACSAVVHLNLRTAAPEVAKLLDDPIPDVRHCALETLKAIGSPMAIPECRMLLRDPDPKIQMQACQTLADLRDRASIPDIAAFLKADSAFTRGQAARALARLGAVDRAREIGDLLQDPDPNARCYALQAVAELGTRGEAPRIQALLQDTDVLVRAEAVRALEVVAGREALPALLELKEDRVPPVAWALTVALCNLGDRERVPAILEGDSGFQLLNGVRRPEVWSRLRALDLREPVEGTVADLRAELQKRAGMRIDWPAPAPGRGKWLSSRCQLGRGSDPLPFVNALQELADQASLIVENDRLRFVPEADAKKFWQDWWTAEPKR
jgi:hypothetical protein